MFNEVMRIIYLLRIYLSCLKNRKHFRAYLNFLKSDEAFLNHLGVSISFLMISKSSKHFPNLSQFYLSLLKFQNLLGKHSGIY